MPRSSCCWRRRSRTDPESPSYVKEVHSQQTSPEKHSPSVTNDSTEGNPRNKCALQPGHSLMDWIRLGQSGRDLTGVGSRAGTLSVSPLQLAEHCHADDAWIAIRGKVYNVTAYLPFHPGGQEELMRGVGRDATNLFNEVHAWVNYESILQKCLVGRLTYVEPDVDTEALFYGMDKKETSKSNQSLQANDTNMLVRNGSNKPVDEDIRSFPRFDWIQKTDNLTTIFYTKPYCNPLLEVMKKANEEDVKINIICDSYCYTNIINFTDNLHWPCIISINYETGKIETTFRKIISKIWHNFGTLTQTAEKYIKNNEEKVKYSVVHKIQMNYNTWIIALSRNDRIKHNIPIGQHIRVYGIWNGQDISRSYTPVPFSIMKKLDPNATVADICLIVKEYPQGLLSPYICSRSVDDVMEISKPLGSFDLHDLENKEAFLLLAAGTGITPMLSLLLFILERRIKRCQYITLLFFNRKEEDIICRKYLDGLHEIDSRFKVEYILSEPDENWKGKRGHVSYELLKHILEDQCKDNHLFPADIFTTVCGPTVFTNLAKSLLHDIGYQKQHMHCFLG